MVALRHAYDKRRHYAKTKHYIDIHSHYCRNYHYHIRQYKPHRLCRCSAIGHCELGGFNHIKSQRDKCRRNGQPHIGSEFVGHFAALGAGGCNGGIGDERQVVAEKSSAKHNRYHKGSTAARGSGYFGCQRCQCHHSANRRAHCQRYKARGNEYAGDNQSGRQQTQYQINCSVNRSYLLGNRRKSSGKNKNPYHIYDIGMAGGTRKYLNALSQSALVCGYGPH